MVVYYQVVQNRSILNILLSFAKFLNRKREVGWINPTTRHLVQTHLSLFKEIEKLLPVDAICFEMNKFAFMQMDDHTCQGIDFQNGRLKGYSDKYEYIDARQNNLCCLCEKNHIEHYHHLVHRRDGGSDLPENLIGVCKSCHEKIHLGKLKTKIKGIKKKYHHLSVLNQAIPFIIDELKKFDLPVNLTTGKSTYDYRVENEIVKDHYLDAACIAASVFKIEHIDVDYKPFEIMQFRNHNRQIIHRITGRKYSYNEEHVATNRKDRCEQKGDSLHTWYQKQIDLVGIDKANKMLSQLKVKKSEHVKNNLDRYLPGTIFRYNGKCYVESCITSKNYFKVVNKV